MPNAPGGVAVVATMVARSDRRALSQAWYSALHLAQRAPVTQRPQTRHVIAGVMRAETALTHETSHAPVVRTQPAARMRAQPARVVPGEASLERRRPACETVRRVEHALTKLAAQRYGQAAQTVDVAGGRVRLLVRTDRAATRIVAVCSAPLREPVERALAQARFLLARDGFSIGMP